MVKVVRNELWIMLSPAVLFAGSIVGLQIIIVYSSPASEIDFRTILELAQKQALQNEIQSANYDLSSKEDYRTQYGSLTSREILELLQQSNYGQVLQTQSDKSDYNRNKNKKKPDHVYGHYDRYEELNNNKVDNDYRYESKVQHGNKHRDDEETYSHSRFNELALQELLSRNVLENQYEDKPRKKVKPNSLLGSNDVTNDNSENNGGGYSKVYVILNPQAIEKSKNKDELNSLLVKILSLTASSLGKEQGKRIKERRYKGFPVKTGLLTRRARRDSREIAAYMGKDADEEEYKPKRTRNGSGGGGGGGGGGGVSGGRTAIPYIRHHGDIYERDN